MKKIALCFILLLAVVVINVFAADNSSEMVDNSLIPEELVGADVYVLTPEEDMLNTKPDTWKNQSIFSDLEPNHWAAPYIEKMVKERVINGYPDGTFMPEEQVKVGEFIKLAAVQTWGETAFMNPAYTGDHWAFPYEESLSGISYEHGTYNTSEQLERAITRGEAVKILAPALITYKQMHSLSYLKDYDESIMDNFLDIKDSDDVSLVVSVMYCSQCDIINGFEDKTFRPDETLTRAQAAKIICMMTGGVLDE